MLIIENSFNNTYFLQEKLTKKREELVNNWENYI